MGKKYHDNKMSGKVEEREKDDYLKIVNNQMHSYFDKIKRHPCFTSRDFEYVLIISLFIIILLLLN